jgi:NADH-quinone oxidoreductase subunit A
VATAVGVRVSSSAPCSRAWNRETAGGSEYYERNAVIEDWRERRREGHEAFFAARIAVLENYFPILLFVLVAIVVGAAPMWMGRVLSHLLGTYRPYEAKLSPYECGFEAFEDARMKFDVRYYLVAILFILFDLEIAFLFPWAVALNEIGLFGFISMMIFLLILVVGFIYEWRKGALEWE